MATWDKPVRYVLNADQRGDHTGGKEAMMVAGAQTISQRKARANMVEGKMPGLPPSPLFERSMAAMCAELK